MALIKVKNTWTQVPNAWLQDKNLSLRAKGLLAVMQSLPDGWNFSVVGLASISKEGLNAVRSAVHEIEEAGYLKRAQIRDEQGKIADTIWTLYETPQPVDNPSVENRSMGGATQYNTNKQNTNKKNMSISGSDEPSSTHSPFSFAVSKDEPAGAPGGAPAHPVTDLGKVPVSKETHIDGAVVSQLLKAGGKKDVVTPALVNLVRTQAKKYGGADKLFEIVKRVKFEPFYAKMGMMSLLADKNLSNIVNMDNEVHEPVKKDWRYYQKLDRFDPERIKFFKEHPEYML